ncbi:TPA: restriction endonuclease subunit S [Photobacterium damselae]
MSSLPKLRLSEFSDSDKYCSHKFDDIFSFSSGKNIKQNESSPEFSTPCVRYGELYHMYGEVITRTINNTNLEHSELTFSAGNEILLPSAGEDPLDIGSASALTLEGVAIGRTINVLRPKGTIDYSHIYVSYYINEKLRKRISQLARGASISNVYNSDLKTLKACLPSFPEQQKIASFLSKVDEKIALLTEKKEKLTEYKKGVMQQLFNGKWEEQDGQLTFIPPTLRFKADDGSAFPDWEEKKLGKAVSIKSSKVIPYEGFDLPCIELDNLSSNTGEIIGDISVNGALSQKNRFKSGDVLFGKLRPYLRKFAHPHFAGICSSEIWVMSVTKELSSNYLFQFVQTEAFISETNKSSGTKMPRADWKVVSQMAFSLPHIKEQLKIAGFLSAIDQKIDLVSSELEKAKEWKKGLLQQMFV